MLLLTYSPVLFYNNITYHQLFNCEACKDAHTCSELKDTVVERNMKKMKRILKDDSICVLSNALWWHWSQLWHPLPPKSKGLHCHTGHVNLVWQWGYFKRCAGLFFCWIWDVQHTLRVTESVFLSSALWTTDKEKLREHVSAFYQLTSIHLSGSSTSASPVKTSAVK